MDITPHPASPVQPAPPSSFLFITNSPRSFSARKPVAGRKVRASDKQKNAHVQQGYWQAKKKASTRKLRWKKAVLVRDQHGLRLKSKSKSRSPNPASPHQYGNRGGSANETEALDPNQLGPICPSTKLRHGDVPSTRSYGFVQEEPSVGVVKRSPKRTTLKPQAITAELVRMHSGRTPSAYFWVKGSCPSPRVLMSQTSFMDPFATAASPINEDINSDLMHCTSYLIPTVYQFPAQAQCFTRYWLEAAFTEPVMLYAVLAAAMLHRRAVMSHPIFAHITSHLDRQFLSYKVMAIQMINVSMEDHEKAFRPSTIWAITTMLGIETMMGTEAEMRVHRLGLLRLLSLRGGIHGLSELLLDSLLPTLHWASYWTSLKPQYPPPFSGQPLSPATLARVNAALPSTPYEFALTGLETPQTGPLVIPALNGVIHDLRLNIHFRELAATVPDGHWNATLHEIEHINYLAHSVRYELLAFEPADFAHPEQECIAIALATFTAATDEFFDAASPVCRALIPRLKNALQRSDLRFFWNPAHEALLWVLALGALQSTGQPERPWFILQLARGMELLEVKSVDELRRLLERFTYVERLYGSAVGQVWEEVAMMREAVGRQWHP